MSKPTNQWAKSTGSPKQVRGYFGDDALLPGSPLLRIQGIKKGEEYLDAVYRLNGLKDKKALFRYIIANASPTFLEDMGLSEGDAQAYLDTAVSLRCLLMRQWKMLNWLNLLRTYRKRP